MPDETGGGIIMKKKIVVLLGVLFLVLVGCSTKSDEGSVEHTVTGIVADGTSMNILQIETEEGKLLTFATTDAEIDAGSEGILIGATVEVTYLGTLEEGTTATATKVVVTKNADTSTGEDDLVELTAIIVGKTDTTITVEMTDGITFTFVTEDVPVEGADELLIGDEVMIYYVGVLNSRQEIQSVEISKIEVIEPSGIQPLDGE